MGKGKLFVLSAPSGAGKTTLKDMLLKHFPNLRYSVSATTRPKREGEVEGEHYFFKTPGEFQSMIDNGAFIEYNQVHGNFYGTPKPSVEKMLKNGYHVILDLDVYGKVNFDKEYPEAVGILILPPDNETLKKRLQARRSDSPEVIETRLKNAIQELEFGTTKGKYEYTVVNDKLDEAFETLKGIMERETESAS